MEPNRLGRTSLVSSQTKGRDSLVSRPKDSVPSEEINQLPNLVNKVKVYSVASRNNLLSRQLSTSLVLANSRTSNLLDYLTNLNKQLVCLVRIPVSSNSLNSQQTQCSNLLVRSTLNHSRLLDCLANLDSSNKILLSKAQTCLEALELLPLNLSNLLDCLVGHRRRNRQVVRSLEVLLQHSHQQALELVCLVQVLLVKPSLHSKLAHYSISLLLVVVVYSSLHQLKLSSNNQGRFSFPALLLLSNNSSSQHLARYLDHKHHSLSRTQALYSQVKTNQLELVYLVNPLSLSSSSNPLLYSVHQRLLHNLKMACSDFLHLNSSSSQLNRI